MLEDSGGEAERNILLPCTSTGNDDILSSSFWGDFPISHAWVWHGAVTCGCWALMAREDKGREGADIHRCRDQSRGAVGDRAAYYGPL